MKQPAPSNQIGVSQAVGLAASNSGKPEAKLMDDSVDRVFRFV
jgi:hypothetical protein